MVLQQSFTTDSSARAAALLVADGVVALPTETVYGLGALATSAAAVSRVFEVKGRPATNPLIVHIADGKQLDQWAINVPDNVRTLVAEFWPGPLTVVLPSRGTAVPAVTANLNTVALRSPDNGLFLDVLRELEALGVPAPGIAAPSANRYGRVSPTTAAHVAAELAEFLHDGDGILDGGPCRVGLESTILVCHEGSAFIARHGAVTEAELAKYVEIKPAESRPPLPGSALSHYSPEARVHVVDAVSDVAESLRSSTAVGAIGLVSDLASAPANWLPLLAASDSEAFAKNLYSALRAADDAGLTDVVAIAPRGEGIELAIRDRLQRAAR